MSSGLSCRPGPGPAPRTLRKGRKKGKTGGAIFVPNQYVGNRCLVLMELFDDENEVPKWINFIIQAIKARPYEDPRYPYR